MWKCIKLPKFSIQKTEKLFMPNVTFDSNTVFGERDSRPTGRWYTTVSICQIQRHLSSFGRYTGCLPLTYNSRHPVYHQNSSSAFGQIGS